MLFKIAKVVQVIADVFIYELTQTAHMYIFKINAQPFIVLHTKHLIIKQQINFQKPIPSNIVVL